MTDITALAKRLRGYPEIDECEEAADALEAQAKEIAGLKAEIDAWHESANWPDKSPGRMRARIAELEALLKPFAEASDYVDGIYHLDDNAAIYIKVAYLRAARAKLKGKKG